MTFETQRFFDGRAKAWDNREDSGHSDLMLSLADLQPGVSILDAGCGTGILVPRLLRYDPGSVTCVDFAPNMINLAQKKYRDARVRFLCTDFFQLSPEDYRFDVCIFYNALLHFPHPLPTVRHASRLLRPGGRLIISHTQGKRAGNERPGATSLPARDLINLLCPLYRLDVLIDNNVMLMASGIRMEDKAIDPRYLEQPKLEEIRI